MRRDDLVVTTDWRTLWLGVDHLVVLVPSYLEDRVRRIAYEQVRQVMVWRGVPVMRIVAVMLLLGAGGLGGMMFGPSGWWQGAGVVAMVASSILTTRYLVCGRTVLWCLAGRDEHRFAMIASPRRVESFVEQLVRRIEQAQRIARRQNELHAAGGPGGRAG